jgi:cyd operon protein YbgT
MWYFTWILGLGLAVGFGVLNGLWHEFHEIDAPPGADSFDVPDKL